MALGGGPLRFPWIYHPINSHSCLENGPWMKMYFLLNIGIFQPAMLVYQKVNANVRFGWFLFGEFVVCFPNVSLSIGLAVFNQRFRTKYVMKMPGLWSIWSVSFWWFAQTCSGDIRRQGHGKRDFKNFTRDTPSKRVHIQTVPAGRGIWTRSQEGMTIDFLLVNY